MKYVMFSLLLFVVYAGNAQQSPAAWEFYARKLSDKTYEIHMKSIIYPGWHIYSELQPEEAIAQPTVISLDLNPVIYRKWKIKEVGKLIEWKDQTTGIRANEYSDSVDFVQQIQLKSKIKTNITGNIFFQTCTDQYCLSPKTIKFSIPVQ